MRRSMLVCGHGGPATLLAGTLAVSGHDKARQEACKLRGDDSTLLPLPRLGEVLRRALPACAVVLRVMFRAGEASIHGEVMPLASLPP